MHFHSSARIAGVHDELAQAIGRIVQPEILQDAPVALRAMVEGPTGKDSACELFVLEGESGAPVLVALCHNLVMPERAAAWADGLFAEVNPKEVICISSLPVSGFSDCLPC